MKTFTSDISGKTYLEKDKISGNAIRSSVLELIQTDHPNFTKENFLSISELNEYRSLYINKIVDKQLGDITKEEKLVLKAISEQTTLANKIDGENVDKLTVGQKIADKVATFGGSWTFIIAFLSFLIIWILINIFWLTNKNSFDPYPFILLNLMLSCLAALQAPVIMMSQNRQNEKDRERAKSDYMINLKSELEIRILNEKLDHLILHQQQYILEVQKMQTEILEDILSRFEKGKVI